MTTGSEFVKPRRSQRRTWVFRLLAVLMGLACVLLLEVGLRVFGLGADLSLIVPQPNASGWYQLNPQFDQPYFGRGDLSGPEPQPFQIPKPSGTRRILVVGGSTVIGFPYPSELAFPRHLQVFLAAQAEHGERIEVLNAGITALNSATELVVVQEGHRIEPDVIVVYTGHNEFYGPGGGASPGSWMGPAWFRAMSKLRRAYLVQLVQRLTTSSAAVENLMESLPGDLHIPLGSSIFQQTVSRFDENLSAMARLARDARVPILFVSPVGNEHDQPPIENLADPALNSNDEVWRSKLRRCDEELESGEITTAIEQLELAKAERDHDPLVRFRLAQAYEAAGRKSLAVEQYQAALDLDGCRFRSPSILRKTMEAVAQRHAQDNARFLDLYSVFRQAEVSGVPGRKHFLEHVHFTFEGNQLVGESIARAIWQDVWGKEWLADRRVDDTTLRTRLAIQEEDELAARALALMIYQKPPFRDGTDAPLLAKRIATDSINRFRDLSITRQKLFAQVSSSDMAGDLISHLVRTARSENADELLGIWLRAQVIRQPWQTDARAELVNWLRTHGQASKADEVQRGAGIPACLFE